jgi:thiol-disulfide isomerase/thioredoxin
MVKTACVVVLSTLLCGLCFAETKPAKTVAEGALPEGSTRLKIGDAAPDFSLLGVDGKTYTLADFKDAPILVVAFLSNHCPVSHAAETRLIPFAKEMAGKGVAFVAINPNSPEGLRVDELGYSKYNDSYDEMKLYAKDQGFPFPYLYDGGTQKTARAYGCLCTPDIFIFDKDRKLRYSGRFDDSRFADVSTVKAHEARDAVEVLLAGKPVAVETTKPFGCSTKWLEKKTDVAKATEKWTSEPVTMETIDAAGVEKLAKNDTKKLRMINVWATWCGPCVAEFPELVSISRRMSGRDFELITISIDDKESESAAKEFLEKQHAAVPARVQKSLKSEGRSTNNYLFTGADSNALMSKLDPQAPGPVPYTVIIAPGGKIVYRKSGAIESSEVLAKIMETMGPYYTPTEK